MGNKMPITADKMPMMGVSAILVYSHLPDGLLIGLWLEAGQCFRHWLVSCHNKFTRFIA